MWFTWNENDSVLRQICPPSRQGSTDRWDEARAGRQAERLRKFPRSLGQIPPSFLAKPRRVPAPPVTSAPASPHRLGNREFKRSLDV